MGNERIERMAREAGLPMGSGGSGRPGVIPLWEHELARFAALVAEECAKICDDGGVPTGENIGDWEPHPATAIRFAFGRPASARP